VLTELKVKEFMAEVASGSPAPGGGSVSAMAASAGAGLISMLANLTKDKKGCEAVSGQMAKTAEDCSKMSEKFLAVIDEDTKAFNAYMTAIRMPKETDGQKTERLSAMKEAAKSMTLVPLQLAKNAFELFETAEWVLKNGNKFAMSDGAVGVLLLRAGILGAICNVRINLGSIGDEEFVSTAKKEADAIEAETLVAERRILGSISFD